MKGNSRIVTINDKSKMYFLLFKPIKNIEGYQIGIFSVV